jgi:hypothetical protein
MDKNVLKNRLTRRTTVTLEADVADFIEKTLRQNKELKEKQLINQLICSGIKSKLGQPIVKFKIESFKSKLMPEISAEDLEQMLDEI